MEKIFQKDKDTISLRNYFFFSQDDPHKFIISHGRYIDNYECKWSSRSSAPKFKPLPGGGAKDGCKIYFLPFQFIITLLFCFLASQLHAAEYYWPSSPRTPVNLKEIWITFDQVKIKTYQVNFGGLKLEMPYLANYSVGPKNPHWNAFFIYPEQPTIALGITIFNKGDLLPQVTPEEVQNYIKGLQVKGAKEIQSTALGNLTYDLALLGKRPEQIEYTMGKTRYVEYFVELNEKIIIFGFEAPAHLFEENKENARLIFARMRVL